ncbi:MAG: 50S ribosomal protein L3 [Candidatus Methanomethylicaceae archaeon]|nr:50S ribosomal protein L3 [Candidatus Verstraetearchaeota archaeon]
MGHRKKSAPRRGSLMYYPRVRARRITGRIRNWPEVKGAPTLLGFAGYKVGMTHIVMVDNKPKSPLYGREVVKAVTVVETPPIYIFGIRAYVKTHKGLKTFGEFLKLPLPKYADRVLTIPKDEDFSENQKKIEENLDKISDIRILALTQPHKSGIGKKTPEILEIKIGGDNIKAIYEYAKSILGKEIRAKEFFKEGMLVDVIAVTKGKGFAGAVKRFGVKILPKWHKHRKGHRVVGAISPSSPSMMFTVPRPGKMGFHQRTEYNKIILKVGDNPSEINVAGGFLHYGLVRGDYVIVAGSIPGSAKRLIRFRCAIRAKQPVIQPPKIVTISLSSKQGV